MKKRLLGILTAALIALTSLAAALPVAAAGEKVTLTIANKYHPESGSTADEVTPISIIGAKLAIYRIGKMEVLSDKEAKLTDFVAPFGDGSVPTDIGLASDRLAVINALKAIIKEKNPTPEAEAETKWYNDEVQTEDLGLGGFAYFEGLDPEYVYLVVQTGATETGNAKDYELAPILATLPDYTFAFEEGVADLAIEGKYASLPETGGVNVYVQKVWLDADGNELAEDEIPGPIEVTLKDSSGAAVRDMNGIEIADTTQIISESAGWSYTWTDLYEGEAGNPIKYTVEESKVDGYTTTVTELSASELPQNVQAGYGFRITNKITPKKTPTPTVTPTVTPEGPRTTRTRTSTSSGTATRVKTGDTNNLILWGIIIAVAVVVIIVAVVVRRRRKSDE